MQLADVLDVSADELLRPSPKRSSPVQACSQGDALYRAFTRPVESNGVAVDVNVLRRKVLDAWSIWQTSATRYSQLSPELPALVTEVERALRSHRTDSTPAERKETHTPARRLDCGGSPG
jgi:hypothetical protein